MKKYFTYLFVVILVGCQQEPVDFVNKESTSTSGPITSDVRSAEVTTAQPIPNSATVYDPLTDWSGQIETRVWSVDYPASSMVTGYCNIGSGYVLIGGGAYPQGTSGDAGAFLTESRPDWNSTPQSWVASSKQHIHADSHGLRVYAIGLKIQGVSAATLKAAMQIKIDHSPNNPESTWQPFPNYVATLDQGYLVVGGGAQLHWNGGVSKGNLLVKTSPNLQNRTWYAEGKHHIVTSPGWIEVYAIGIPSTIPGFNGEIEVTTNMFDDIETTAIGGILGTNSNYSASSGYAAGCPHGYTTYSTNQGRMLDLIIPASTDLYVGSTVSSKDINIWSPGSILAGNIGIRKKP